MNFNSLKLYDVADPNSNKMSVILIVCAWTTFDLMVHDHKCQADVIESNIENHACCTASWI